MGNWNINIQGIGSHHNAKPEIDADLMAVEFVAFLRGKGHMIESASFTSGGKIDLLGASQPKVTAQAVLNGRSVILPGVVSYERIREEWGGIASQPSIVFRKARHGEVGILSPERSVEIVDGTVFNVADTSNA